jgi:hypothetical protein
MGERRGSARQKSLLRGCIYFNNRRSAIDCLVRDISPSGARLIFSDAVSLPEAVDLHIPHKQTTLRARVQWRHGDEVGVVFPNDHALASAPVYSSDSELAQRVEKLESEIASLRRMLKRLKAELMPKADEAA